MGGAVKVTVFLLEEDVTVDETEATVVGEKTEAAVEVGVAVRVVVTEVDVLEEVATGIGEGAASRLGEGSAS